MGGGGTDVARQVADVVLENDDPRTMLVAIGRGRAIYDNGRKSIHFILSTNLSEIVVVLILSVALVTVFAPLALRVYRTRS